MKPRHMLLNAVLIIFLAAGGYTLTIYLDLKAAPPHGSGLPSDANNKNSEGQRTHAPEFSFETLDGQTYTLSSFQGRIVILNFWASWCAPCIKEFPLLLRAAREHDDVILIALSSDLTDEAIHTFMKRPELDWSADNVLVARDSVDVSGKLFQTFKLPETFIIDAQQKIAHKFTGAAWTYEDLKGALLSAAE